MLSLAEAAERLGRGAQPGDRQNDVAARLRTVAKDSTSGDATQMGLGKTRWKEGRSFADSKSKVFHT